MQNKKTNENIIAFTAMGGLALLGTIIALLIKKKKKSEDDDINVASPKKLQYNREKLSVVSGISADGENFVYVPYQPKRKSLNMQVSDKGVDFIKSYEGFSSKPYKVGQKGNLTIGYGHEIKQNENFTEITETEAVKILKTDLKNIEDGINRNFDGKELSQNQFDALVSFGINRGRSGLIKSAIFRLAQKGTATDEEIIEAFRSANTVKKTYSKGLDRRRCDEAEMYLYGDYTRHDDLSVDKVKN